MFSSVMLAVGTLLYLDLLKPWGELGLAKGTGTVEMGSKEKLVSLGLLLCTKEKVGYAPLWPLSTFLPHELVGEERVTKPLDRLRGRLVAVGCTSMGLFCKCFQTIKKKSMKRTYRKDGIFLEERRLEYFHSKLNIDPRRT